MTDTNQKQLGNTLWSIADQLRGAMDADDFRDTMLSFLFLRVELDHFRDVTKMVPKVVTRQNLAAGFYQCFTRQEFLDYSNRRRRRVTEESSVVHQDQ